MDELRASRGRLALVVGEQADTDSLVQRLSRDLGLTSVHLGWALADRPTDELSRAFELATLEVPPGPQGAYPMIEIFAEGSRRAMVARDADR